MNVRRLRRVQRHILAEPATLDMNEFLCRNLDLNMPYYHDNYAINKTPSCGTVGCIAGWTVQLYRGPRSRARLMTAGRDLGLTKDQACRLFFFKCHDDSQHWPQQFEDKYHAAKTPFARAKVTAKRIDHFIATKGAE